MRKFFALLVLAVMASNVVYGGDSDDADRTSISVGLLNGGGSLIGVDIEQLVTDSVGIGLGAGMVGFGGGINFHLYPSINSPSIRIGYSNQGGTGDKLAMRSVYASYMGRNANGILEWQLGLAVPLEIGPLSAFRASDVPPVILMYSIGAYFSM